MTRKLIIFIAVLVFMVACSIARGQGQVSTSEVRLTAKSTWTPIANRYRFGIDSATGMLICVKPNNTTCLAAGGGGGGSGTVTSVAATVPSYMTVTGSPITTSGTLAFTFAAQAPELFLAGPVSGGNDVPSFRGIAATDLPTHTHAAADVSSGLLATARMVSGTATINRCLHINASGVITVASDDCNAAPPGTGITSLNGASETIQTLSGVNDTNVTLAITTASGNHEFALGWTGALAKARQFAGTVYNDQANTYTTGAQDMSAASSLRVPVSAGFAPTISGTFGYDSTSNTYEGGINGANKTFAMTDSDITGNAATATTAGALSANPSNCAAGQASGGVAANGTAEDCFTPSGTGVLDATYLTATTNSALTNELVVTPGGNMERRVNETNSNGGPYTLDFAPGDPTVMWIKDEFGTGANTTTDIGALGWQVGVITAAPTVTTMVGASPNFGITRLVTSAAATEGGTLSLGGDTNPIGNLAAVTNWQMYWIFRLTDITKVRFRIGIANTTADAEPASGIWLRFDTSTGFADTTFKFETRSGSTSTVVNTTVGANTSFHTLRIRSTTAGTILMRLDSGTEQTLNTTVPTVTMNPVLILVSDEAVNKNADADFFAFRIRGLSR